MDFLGLRTLTVIQNIIAQVKKNHGIEIDLNKLNYHRKYRCIQNLSWTLL